jgi:hypothetical protein
MNQVQQPLASSPKRSPLRRIALLAVIAALTGFAGAVAYLGRPYDAVREFGLDTPAVPSPNAHDLYRQANDAIRFAPVAVVLDKPGLANEPEDPKKYPLAGKKRWLAENARGFSIFKQAQKANYLYPPIRTPQNGGNIEPAYELRSLAKYKVVQCQVLAAQNQPEEAVQCALDIWQLGIDAARGASLEPALYGIAIESHARRALGSEIAHLNGQQAARAARRLEELLKTRVSYEAILREERAAMLVQQKPAYEKAIRDAQQERKNREIIESGDYSSVHYDTGPAPELKGPLVNGMIRYLAHHYARGMDALIAGANTSWPKRPTAPPDVPGPNPKINDLLAVLQKSRFHFSRADVQGQIFLARLALHAYRKDTGVYPPTLEALVPKYLHSTPSDPFSDGQALRYARDGKRYNLWSIGPDARDDGGKPAQNPHPRTARSKYLVTEDATGDIVANISE